MAADAQKLLQQYSRMQSQRSEYETHWRECYKYTYPQRGTAFAGVTSQQQAQQERAELFDSTCTDAARTLASTLQSGMTPSNSQWLEFKTTGADPVADAWLSECSAAVWANIASSNFDCEAFEAILDAVIAGWCCVFVDYDRTRGGFVFQQWPIYECFVSSTNGHKVDVIFRKYEMTQAEAVAAFGDKVGAKTKADAERNPDKKVSFLHAIYPRNIYLQGGKAARNMPFASVTVNCEEKTIVRESGFHEFPVAVPRMMRIPGTQYAIGPTSDALPDVKELNALKRFQKAAAEMAISPPFIAEDDGVLNPAAGITLGPKRIIIANSVNSIKPLATGADFNVSFTSEQRLQAQIRRVMMADQLPPVEAGQQTATEINARLSLIRQQLAPLYGRFQAEYLTPITERCFWIMYRAGALPTPPEQMQNADFTVRYDSPLARAQKMQEAQALSEFEAGLGGLAQTFGPEVLDIYDPDAANREKASALGLPSKVLRSDDDIAALRKQRSESQQSQQAQDMQNQVALQATQAALNQPQAGAAAA